jgi:hypothetical protein
MSFIFYAQNGAKSKDSNVSVKELVTVQTCYIFPWMLTFSVVIS